MSSKILVVGATGQQGGAVVKALLRSKQCQPVALTRNTEGAAAQKLAGQGVELVKGSFADRTALVAALKAVDAAFLVTTPLGKGGVDQEEIDGRTFVDAAKEAKLKFLVFSSVGDAPNKTGVPHFDSKYHIEQYIEQSGVPHAIVRPVAFYDNFPKRSGVPTFLAFGLFEAALCGKRLKFIAVRDIGNVAAAMLASPDKYKGRAIDLAGDDLTISQVQDAYARVQGFRPWKAYLPSVAVLALPFDFKRMLQWFYSTGYSADIAALKREFPETLTFEEWLRQED